MRQVNRVIILFIVFVLLNYKMDFTSAKFYFISDKKHPVNREFEVL
jgi:hypothetical protein